MAEVGINLSVESVVDVYDNAIDETTNRFYKAEVFCKQGQLNSLDQVESATLEIDALVQQQKFSAATRRQSTSRV